MSRFKPILIRPSAQQLRRKYKKHFSDEKDHMLYVFSGSPGNLISGKEQTLFHPR